MLIVTLFKITKRCKWPKCPLSDELVNKMWYIYILSLKRTKKSKVVLVRATTWMNLKKVMLSERGQTKKVTYYMIPLYKISRRGKSTETESRLVVVRGRRKGDGEWLIGTALGVNVLNQIVVMVEGDKFNIKYSWLVHQILQNIPKRN